MCICFNIIFFVVASGHVRPTRNKIKEDASFRSALKQAQILNSDYYVNWDLLSYKAAVIKKEACG